MPADNLILIGASVRAAAFSALKAGLRPWCADLFADVDLQAQAPVQMIPAQKYPLGFVDILGHSPQAPWMYTGGLENYPTLIEKLQMIRPLWGNGPQTLKRVRSPYVVSDAFRKNGILHPGVCHSRLSQDVQFPTAKRYLLKPIKGTGGNDIRHCPPIEKCPKSSNKWYYQEFIEGSPMSALYTRNNGEARLLGVVRQLIGESWLNASPFSYCGSISPISLSQQLLSRFEQIGNVLATEFHLQGVFGVDCIIREDIPFPVEVNPRYTASVEVIELATGIPSLAEINAGQSPQQHQPLPGKVGKAILFAPADIIFPHLKQIQKLATGTTDHWELPACADIPTPCTQIKKGHPILTVFANGENENHCLAELQRRAREIYAMLRL